MLDETTRARLEAFAIQLQLTGHVEHADILALLAAQAQAAPVLAAVEAWHDAMEADDGSAEASAIWHDALNTVADAVDAWRAAREE